jgi:hypothetical protein
MICLIRTNHACPVCMAPKQDFSNLDKKHAPRTVPAMKREIARAFSHNNRDAEEGLRKNGLRGQTVCMHI